MTGPFRPRERRLSGRVTASGSVHVCGRALNLVGRVVDLSYGGVRVQVARGAKHVASGTPVRVSIRLDGSRSKWLHLDGAVRRIDERSFAVVFRNRLAELDEVIQNELVAALEADRIPEVMIVDAETARRELVASAFRAAGCRVTETHTALNAIHALEESRTWMLAIADTKSSDADELRRHVREAFPRVSRIAIGSRNAKISLDGNLDVAKQIVALVEARNQV